MLERFPTSDRSKGPAEGAGPRSATSTDQVPAPPAVETRGLTVSAGDRTILSGVDLAVERGEVLCLLGPSGIGKSTLLKCLNRLTDLEPGLTVRGEVLLDGASIHRRGVDPDRLRSRVGMLFQQPVIFPASILDNAAFGLRHGAVRLPRRERRARAEEALREVGLWPEVCDRLDEPAATLSVGQQQRLCLARTLALDPRTILMDEPTSSLDRRSARTIEELVLQLKGERTILLVTHDPEQARRVADRAACVAPLGRCVDGGDRAAGGGGAATISACAACDDLLRDERFEQILHGETA